MKKLDRLGWADGVAFSAFGNRIGIRVSGAPLPDELLSPLPCASETLPACATVDHLYSLLLQPEPEQSRVRKFNLAYSGASLIGRSLDRQQVITQLISDLHRYVAEFSRRELFVHAGVVAWNGRAIVLPGASFSGKSTLVAELTRAGATYFSDEYAVLDRAGRVHPYPRPLMLRDDQFTNHVISQSFHNGTSAKPLPVGLVLFTNFRDGAQWRPRKLSQSRTILGLLSHTVQARTRPRAALSILQRVAKNCESIMGARGEAHPTATALLAKFEGS